MTHFPAEGSHATVYVSADAATAIRQQPIDRAAVIGRTPDGGMFIEGSVAASDAWVWVRFVEGSPTFTQQQRVDIMIPAGQVQAVVSVEPNSDPSMTAQQKNPERAELDREERVRFEADSRATFNRFAAGERSSLNTGDADA